MNRKLIILVLVLLSACSADDFGVGTYEVTLLDGEKQTIVCEHKYETFIRDKSVEVRCDDNRYLTTSIEKLK